MGLDQYLTDMQFRADPLDAKKFYKNQDKRVLGYVDFSKANQMRNYKLINDDDLVLNTFQTFLASKKEYQIAVRQRILTLIFIRYFSTSVLCLCCNYGNNRTQKNHTISYLYTISLSMSTQGENKCLKIQN